MTDTDCVFDEPEEDPTLDYWTKRGLAAEQLVKATTAISVARQAKLKKAQALIEMMMREYDMWPADTALDKEIHDEAAEICDWEECHVCHAKMPADRGQTVQVEATVMYDRDGSGYPGAWDFICNSCAEEGDDR